MNQCIQIATCSQTRKLKSGNNAETKTTTQRMKTQNKQTQTKQNETKQTNTIKNGTIVVNIGADTVRCTTRSATNTEQEIARMEKTKAAMNNNR